MGIEHSVPSTHPDRQMEDRIKAEDMERGMAAGTKYPPQDLIWYTDYKSNHLCDISDHWRHKESGGVYEVISVGLAATGAGVLAPMVHYVPVDQQGPKFERQLVFFMERFEPVKSSVVWERLA